MEFQWCANHDLMIGVTLVSILSNLLGSLQNPEIIVVCGLCASMTLRATPALHKLLIGPPILNSSMDSGKVDMERLSLKVKTCLYRANIPT